MHDPANIMATATGERYPRLQQDSRIATHPLAPYVVMRTHSDTRSKIVAHVATSISSGRKT